MTLKPPNFSPTFDVVNQDFSVAGFDAHPTHDLFQKVKSLAEAVRSAKVQDALRAAKESEEVDKSDLGMGVGSRPPSPVGSPQPYVPPPARSSSLFSPPEDDPPPLRAESLVGYIRSFNKGSLPEFKQPPVPPIPGIEQIPVPTCNLAIWSRIKRSVDFVNSRNLLSIADQSTKLSIPVILRFTIADVLTAYVSLIFEKEEDPLVIEKATAFGPRERKFPHEQSDYQVYQVLSQHLAKMLQSHPLVPLQTLMQALVSYRTLFVDQCTSCQRVLSLEGHIPPVGRIWIPKDGSFSNSSSNHDNAGRNKGQAESGVSTPGAMEVVSGKETMDHLSMDRWEPRHVTCLYS
ncbi:hypothetical protein F5J12DRAFT_713019 [Pisolithus orientalis]|uniref:uncharacterized protein n=1 Tax=Pisolithus orientalis TaxID=936130 RepID=UPI002224B826|nr:uncharacterized protein F5J12DRAFT_713019 [Pisolithus orientalis]KAI6032811.1 hypothetical protein F5J12DRAFT_713019 [Pisolithus orientalis]